MMELSRYLYIYIHESVSHRVLFAVLLSSEWEWDAPRIVKSIYVKILDEFLFFSSASSTMTDIHNILALNWLLAKQSQANMHSAHTYNIHA